MADKNPRYRIPVDLGRQLTPPEMRQVIIDYILGDSGGPIDFLTVLEATRDALKRIDESHHLTELGQEVVDAALPGVENVLEEMRSVDPEAFEGR